MTNLFIKNQEKCQAMGIIKKSILSLACFIALTCVCFAQDVIVTKDSKKINAKVTEVDIDQIRYIMYDYLDGPVYTIPKSDVVAIIYENGQAETFGAKSATPPPKPAVSVNPDERVLVSFNKGKNWGLKDAAGNVVVTAKYARINIFSEGMAAVNIGGKSKTVYKLVGGISGRYLPFKKFEGGKWGFINTRGEEVIPCKYDYAENFSEGLAVVSIGVKVEQEFFGSYSSTVFTGGEYGFIDTSGNEVIPVIYNSARSFKNGKAEVHLEKDSFFINKEGNRIENL